MAMVVLLITAIGGGIYANMELGNADTKYDAYDILKSKVGQLFDEKLKNSCSNAVYHYEDNKHIFSCPLVKNGGRKSRKNKKSRKFRK